jgi:hypothetical protein
VIRGHALSWPRGELTAIVGMTLLAAGGIFLAGGFRALESGTEAGKKPPGTF